MTSARKLRSRNMPMAVVPPAARVLDRSSHARRIGLTVLCSVFAAVTASLATFLAFQLFQSPGTVVSIAELAFTVALMAALAGGSMLVALSQARRSVWLDGTVLTVRGPWRRRSADLAAVQVARVRTRVTMTSFLVQLVVTGGGSLRQLSLVGTRSRPINPEDLEALAAALAENHNEAAVADAIFRLQGLASAG